MHQAPNASFHQKLDYFQYDAFPAITGAIRALSREKLYQELGFESLKHRRKYKKLCSFYNVFKNERPTWNPFYSNRNHSNIPPFKTVHNLFKKPFFASTIIEYTNPDSNLRSSDTYGTFKNTILKFTEDLLISVYLNVIIRLDSNFYNKTPSSWT